MQPEMAVSPGLETWAGSQLYCCGFSCLTHPFQKIMVKVLKSHHQFLSQTSQYNMHSYKAILCYVTREDDKSLNKTNNRVGGKLVPLLN
jgi:hypothetical protein